MLVSRGVKECSSPRVSISGAASPPLTATASVSPYLHCASKPKRVLSRHSRRSRMNKIGGFPATLPRATNFETPWEWEETRAEGVRHKRYHSGTKGITARLQGAAMNILQLCGESARLSNEIYKPARLYTLHSPALLHIFWLI